MPFPAECPVCKTLLAFPDISPAAPVKCPSCLSRFVVEGRKVAHLAFEDYYALLGVSPDSDQAEIRKAVRAKILEHHPDRNPGDPAAADRLRAVIRAKEILTDPEKRRIFDGVYHAKSLPEWRYESTKFSRAREPGMAPQYQSQGRRGSRYEEILTQASNRSRVAAEQDIQHLIDEIEGIFRAQGLGIDLRHGGGTRRAESQLVWGFRGAMFFALASFIVGLTRGSYLGAVVLASLGFAIGWILGSSAGSLISLVFLLARLSTIGFFIGVAATSFTGVSGGLVRSLVPAIELTAGSLAGAAALGLYRMAVGTIAGRSARALRYEVVHSATYGAWFGALAGLVVIYARVTVESPLESLALAWFILLSVYLIIDHRFFSQPSATLY